MEDTMINKWWKLAGVLVAFWIVQILFIAIFNYTESQAIQRTNDDIISRETGSIKPAPSKDLKVGDKFWFENSWFDKPVLCTVVSKDKILCVVDVTDLLGNIIVLDMCREALKDIEPQKESKPKKPLTPYTEF